MSTSPLAAAADRWGDRLPRRLGLWSAVAVLVGSTIGGGIFRTPAIIAERVPAPLPMFGVWILGGLLALCGALTYAELAALFPRSGGVYVYIREGFGRLPAFLFGWTELLLIRASALGAISTPFAEYFLRSLGLDPKVEPNATYVHYVAAGAIVVTATLNYVGVRWSSMILNMTTSAISHRLRELPPRACSGSRWCRCCGSTTAGATCRSWAAKCRTPSATYRA